MVYHSKVKTKTYGRYTRLKICFLDEIYRAVYYLQIFIIETKVNIRFIYVFCGPNSA